MLLFLTCVPNICSRINTSRITFQKREGTSVVLRKSVRCFCLILTDICINIMKVLQYKVNKNPFLGSQAFLAYEGMDRDNLTFKV
jgi:hypothetical protein